MKSNPGISRRIAGVSVGALLGGAVAATIAIPAASAAPDCSPGGVANTVNTVQTSALSYLDGHPGANQALMSARGKAPAQAAADVRAYFTANPAEYYELRGILAPIGETQSQCNVSALPPTLSAAYDQFMAG
ncbi:heme-binding protein [[Mycobacterium] burgundiense]|uniref:Heme-binding protein n=1 Tax=[Mycobacterium] burgundiense TaxID=3064286 RepID=A0ABM9LK32_9MYCO|nr:heme-binding protein [Mycolicibacterium sp. MU0053]CAJ1500259.1 heme-binding protein [Mycolicibacterium sp. MU0053]